MLSGCGSSPTQSDAGGNGARSEAEQLGALPAEPVLPSEAVQQFDRAVTLMSAGDLAQAEQGFRSLATAYPAYSGPLLNLGILHTKAGRLDEAETAIREAIARNGNNAAAFNQLGIVHRKLGRFKEADEAYTRALQIDPNYALAYLNLGVLCDLYLQEPQRALEAYERYLSLASAPDAKVSGWVSELKKRIGTEPRSAQANDPG
ncbi:MAG: tetratricopeptide repeat protein [Pseudomonadota bacterium]|nr:tetratricopeptide repeat protein [Pseudomonadota bacterium]